MARQGEPFDEIMIVNPLGQRGDKCMRFYPIAYAPLSGYFAEVPADVGYVYEAPETMGYFAEYPETVGYYAEAPEVMGYAEAPSDMGYFADPPPGFTEGYSAPATQVAYFAETPEFAEAPSEMGDVYEAPDVMGYGEVAPEMGYYAEAPPTMEGYVRETEPSFSPRVVPLDNVGGVEGYMRPRSINPMVEKFQPAETAPQASIQWFKPLW